MVVGFNHNIRYQGETYHIQTEDSGLKNPHVITHLYRGGTILATKKTGYADITRAESMPRVVEDLMKEQHKEMLRSLKNGEFDQVIAARFGSLTRLASVAVGDKSTPAATRSRPTPQALSQGGGGRSEQRGAVRRDQPKPDQAASLDDLILSYLTGDDDES